jgi:cytoskeletal protein RodZ
MAEQLPGGIGVRLHNARLRRGLSLGQISDATKISMSVLEALERDDITKVPAGIFARAFVRAYAMQVGLDPDEAVQEFMAQFPGDSVTAGHPTAHPIEDNEALESDRRIARAVVRLAAVSLLLVAIGVYLKSLPWRDGVELPPGQPRPPLADREALAAVPISATDAVAPTAGSLGDAAANPALSERPTVAADRVVVNLSATAPCWVSVVVDGEPLLERELEPGEHQIAEMRQTLVLRAGNAGALTITIDGAAARPLGKLGQVVTARLNRDNVKEYLAVQ